MAYANYVFHQIDMWEQEGLISHEQAEVLKHHELESVPERRVQANEIFVYLGSLAIFLALAFLVVLNWEALGKIGRILAIFLPTASMLGLGGWLSWKSDSRLQRGAQALLLGGCLLTGITFGVIFNEFATLDWDGIAFGDPLVLASCLLATGTAVIAFVKLPTVTQSIALHICGTTVMISILNWLFYHYESRLDSFEESLMVLAVAALFGGIWLTLARWLQPHTSQGVVRVSRLFGAATILFPTYITAVIIYNPTPWQKITLELATLLCSIGFLAASIKAQSRTFLYSGAVSLLFIITEINFTHFADKVGMPIALFIAGVLLIGLGLGTERLNRKFKGSR